MTETHGSSDEDAVALPQSVDFDLSLADDSTDPGEHRRMEEAPGLEPKAPPQIVSDVDGSPVKNGKQLETCKLANGTLDKSVAGLKSKRQFDVVFKTLPAAVRAEYVPVPPADDEVSRVIERISSLPGESWWKVEFENGKIDEITFDDLINSPNGQAAFNRFSRGMDFDLDDEDAALRFDNKPRKRKAGKDPDYSASGVENDDAVEEDVNEDTDEDDVLSHRKRRRRQQPAASSIFGRTRSSSRKVSVDQDNESESTRELRDNPQRRKLRARKNPTPAQSGNSFDDDADELSHDFGKGGPSSDDDLFFVTSDLGPGKKRKRRKKLSKARHLSDHSLRGSSIEFEPVRRSGRSNKNTRNMKDPVVDEEMYAEDDKLVGAPKVASVREIFLPVEDNDFKAAHAQQCDTCGQVASAANKGQFIYCQGCSYAYHKVCLGYRSTRDHAVTKIGPDSFVLQCRYCIGVPRQKDSKAPDHAMCQACKADGPACAAFSPKRTAKQEEKLRAENGGTDPITPVLPSLINNAKNVLFRCASCRRAYHFEHLPSTAEKGTVKSDDVHAERLANYSINWKCSDCATMPHKVQTLVAWRPVDPDKYRPKDTTLDVNEDAKEYLIKWETQSYAHCTWKPGAWVYGVTNAIMRSAFPKRNEGQNLMPKWNEKEAIPEEYLLADVILAVKFKGHVRHSSREADLANVHKIDKAKIKYQGLGYDEVVWDCPPPQDSGSFWEAFYSAYAEYLNGRHFKIEPSYKIKERLQEYRSQDFSEHQFKKGEQPASLQGQLMDYQRQGLNWLLYNFHDQRNVVLADEMGLGKTIQIIALLATLALEKPKCWPFLVVVPNSTCPNWRREIKKWAPELRVVTYHGGKAPQQLAYQYELFPDGSKEMRAHVVVMSYDSAQDDHTRSLFKNVHWTGLVVDEGQRLKNDQNLLYGALRAMKIPFRLLLTGTPLQNNKRELFNLLQFIDSSKNAAQLDEEYQEITAENLPKLHELIRPHFLRRTKAEVLGFLPPMAQIIVPVTMSVVQEKLCKSIMAKNPDLIRAIFANGKMKAKERGSLNNILMQLRKCLCHPFVYSGAIEDKSVEPEKMYRNLVEASSKLVLLEIMLPKLKEQGHRVLLFSQFLDELDIIEDFMTGLGFRYGRLDGNMSSLEKQKRIDAFNDPNSELFAFLLSTRAGGVGINLATADTVIILDPDFNPHQDIQALSRAHRIGQKNKVLCFQLMTKNSVEEKIMQIGRKKMALDHALIESMDAEDEAGNDLESILKHGAEALFSDDQKDVIKYDSASVDRLLDRTQIESTKVGSDKSAESQFSLARVWANDKGTLADDLEVAVEPDSMDSNVWENILKEREEEARRQAEMNKEVLGRGGRRRQAVHYNTKTNYGLDEGADGRQDSDSEMDGDFVNNGPESDEESDGGEAGAEPESGIDKGSAPHGAGPRKSQDKKPKVKASKSQPEDRAGQQHKGPAQTPGVSIKARSSPASQSKHPSAQAKNNTAPLPPSIPSRGPLRKVEVSIPRIGPPLPRGPVASPAIQGQVMPPNPTPSQPVPGGTWLQRPSAVGLGQPLNNLLGTPLGAPMGYNPLYQTFQNNLPAASGLTANNPPGYTAANGQQVSSLAAPWNTFAAFPFSFSFPFSTGIQPASPAQPAQVPSGQVLLGQASLGQAHAGQTHAGQAQPGQAQPSHSKAVPQCQYCGLNHSTPDQCPRFMSEAEIRVRLDDIERGELNDTTRKVRDYLKAQLQRIRGSSK